MDFRIHIDLDSNVANVLDGLDNALLRALERCGLQAEKYASDLAPVNKSGGGGVLRQSITHKVDAGERAVYIGTDMEYGPYVEFGTGKHAEKGGGRPGWWVYVPGKKADGDTRIRKIYTREEAAQIVAIMRSKGIDAHMTEGQKPQPFLRPALTNHKQTYRNIFIDELKNG